MSQPLSCLWLTLISVVCNLTISPSCWPLYSALSWCPQRLHGRQHGQDHDDHELPPSPAEAGEPKARTIHCQASACGALEVDHLPLFTSSLPLSFPLSLSFSLPLALPPSSLSSLFPSGQSASMTSVSGGGSRGLVMLHAHLMKLSDWLMSSLPLIPSCPSTWLEQ